MNVIIVIFNSFPNTLKMDISGIVLMFVVYICTLKGIIMENFSRTEFLVQGWVFLPQILVWFYQIKD